MTLSGHGALVQVIRWPTLRRAATLMPALSMLLACAVFPAQAQGAQGAQRAALQEEYDLTWYSVEGGGWLESAGNGYTVGGTIGQHDARSLIGGGYVLTGGFWGFLPAHWWSAYMPLLMRK